MEATQTRTRSTEEILHELLDAAQEFGRDEADANSYPTEHEDAFWKTVHKIARELRESGR